jgi:regulator of sigma E protease
MDGLLADLYSRLMYALPFLFVLTVVVFIHELGHFLVARWCGVKVKAFSIGFGKEIFGFNDRHGTRWRLAWIPLGGYVKFMDDENAASVPSRESLDRMTPEERAGAFQAKPVWQRAAVVAAGPAANFLLAILLFAFMAYTFGVRRTEARVEAVVPESAAAAAGLQAGDLVVSVDGKDITSFSDLQRLVSLSAGRPLDLRVKRGEATLEVPVTPRKMTIDDPIGGKVEDWRIGIQQTIREGTVEVYAPSVLGALWHGVTQTRDVAVGTLTYIADVLSLRRSPDQLGGPVRIADISGKVAKLGFNNLIHLICVISVSVGLINLFPIPLLDGGHLMFYAIEAVRRRPLSERSQEFGFRIGFAVVLTLMILATFNDLPILKRWLGGAG